MTKIKSNFQYRIRWLSIGIFAIAAASCALPGSNHNQHAVLKFIKDQKSADDGLTAVAWSPDGKSIAAAGENRHVAVWNSQSLSSTLQLDQANKGGGYSNVAYSPDGRYLASGLSTVDIWEAASGTLHVRLVAPHVTPGVPQPISIKSVVFSPDGKTLVVGYDGVTWKVIAYRVDDGKMLWSYQPQRIIGTPIISAPVVFSPDGVFVLVGTGEHGGDEVNKKPLARLLFLDAQSGVFRRSIDDIHIDRPTALAISRDGKWIATGTSTGTANTTKNLITQQWVTVDNKDPVRIWDFNSGQLIKELPVKSRVWSLAFSADSKYVIGAKNVERPASMTLAVWDVDSGAMLQEIKNSSGPMGLAVSPDGKRIAAVGENKLSLYEFTISED